MMTTNNRTETIQRITAGRVGATLAIFLIVFLSSPAVGEIFRYRDSQGVLHFSNVPTSVKYTRYMTESGTKTRIDASSYDAVIEEAAREKELPFPLIKAVIHVESCFDAYAVSKRGALGLMQIMPENLKTLDVEDPFNPRENIMGGATYLKKMMTRFQGKLELALAAYNAGPSAVEKYSDIPPYQETIEYVQKVMALYQQYRNA